MIKQKWQFGVTLTETLIVVGILGIVAAIAIPSFNETLARRRIIAAAETIQADLHWARSEAIKRNEDVTVTFTPGAGGAWSYTIDPGSKTVDSATVSDFQDVVLSDNFDNQFESTFDHVRGTVLPGDNRTLILTNPAGELHVVLSTLGRAKICSVGGSIGSYEAC